MRRHGGYYGELGPSGLEACDQGCQIRGEADLVTGLDGAENAIDVRMRHYQIQDVSPRCMRLRELPVIVNGGADTQAADQVRSISPVGSRFIFGSS